MYKNGILQAFHCNQIRGPHSGRPGKADRKCIITSLEKAVDALNGVAGTVVTL